MTEAAAEDYVGGCEGGPWAGGALASTHTRVYATPEQWYEWSFSQRRWVWIERSQAEHRVDFGIDAGFAASLEQMVERLLMGGP